jgi:predicted TIM-barrel fold metal-dependent hydrolase
MVRCKSLAVVLLLLAPLARAQERLPVIDMHMHAWAADGNGPPPLAICTPMTPYAPATASVDAWVASFMAAGKEPPCPDPLWSLETDEALLDETIATMERRNVVGVISGPPDRALQWFEAAPERFIPSAQLQIGRDEYDLDSLRALFEDGPFAVLGEVANQYVGIAPDDERMEPFWALAEDLDVPVAIHMGEGPPGAGVLIPTYRMELANALLLEPVLAKHPGLRVSIMHYGSPFIDEAIALLGAWPQVYLDLGGIQWFYPRAYFYRQLQQIVDAGFGNRVMFGSDQMVWPGLIERSIAIIEEAPFLSDAQKRDILYNNAARFLRLSDETIARHHGR